MKNIRRRTLGLFVFLVALVVPSAALGGVSPAVGTGGGVQGALDSSGGGGSLPFTGLDLVVVAVAGAALLAVGVVLRRRNRSNAS